MCHDYEFLLSAIVHASATIHYSNRIDWLYRCHGQNSSHKVNVLERRAQWYAATFVAFDIFPENIQNYFKEISLEHLGVDAILFESILRTIDECGYKQFELATSKIRTLLE